MAGLLADRRVPCTGRPRDPDIRAGSAVRPAPEAVRAGQRAPVPALPAVPQRPRLQGAGGPAAARDRGGGEIFRYAGRVPTSRLFDDEGFANESDEARLEALSDLNEAFFARDVAAWTGGRRSVNEIGINVLRHWFAPQAVTETIAHSEVLGVVPLEASNGLLDALRELAERHDQGYMVEQVLELLA